MNTTVAVLELKKSDKPNVRASATVQFTLDGCSQSPLRISVFCRTSKGICGLRHHPALSSFPLAGALNTTR